MITILLATTLAAAAPNAATMPQDAPLPGPGRGGMMMRADSNGDGTITRDEHLAQAAERFDRLDANRDGKLTADELTRIGQRMRGMRGGVTPPPAQ